MPLPSRVRYTRLPVGYPNSPELSGSEGADILCLRLALSPARRTLPGVLRVGIGALVDEIGWPEMTIRRCLRELEVANMITVDLEARVLHVTGLILADPPRSRSAIVAWARDLAELPQCGVTIGVRDECDLVIADHALRHVWRALVHNEAVRTDETGGEGLPTTVAIADSFAAAWAAYPNKTGHAEARAVWCNVVGDDADLVNRIVASIEAHRDSAQWKREGGRFVPRLSRWLQGRGWEDTPTPAVSNGSSVPDAAATTRMMNAILAETREARS